MDRQKLLERIKKLKAFSNEAICYVCGKPLKGKVLYIGNGKHRHIGCSAGSKNWLKYRKKSKLYQYFKEVNNE